VYGKAPPASCALIKNFCTSNPLKYKALTKYIVGTTIFWHSNGYRGYKLMWYGIPEHLFLWVRVIHKMPGQRWVWHLLFGRGPVTTSQNYAGVYLKPKNEE
jgi:hypothetical protein